MTSAEQCVSRRLALTRWVQREFVIEPTERFPSPIQSDAYTYVQYTLPTTARQPELDYKCCGLFAGYVLPLSALKSAAGTRAAPNPPSRHVFEPSFGSLHARAARRADPCWRSAVFGFLHGPQTQTRGLPCGVFCPLSQRPQSCRATLRQTPVHSLHHLKWRPQATEGGRVVPSVSGAIRRTRLLGMSGP